MHNNIKINKFFEEYYNINNNINKNTNNKYNNNYNSNYNQEDSNNICSKLNPEELHKIVEFMKKSDNRYQQGLKEFKK